MSPPSTSALIATALALFAASAAVAQRSSPQFSFPPPGAMAAQFGADVFSPGSQDLFTLNQPSSQSLPLSSQGSPNDQSQLIASSLPVAQSPPQRPQESASQQQQQANNIQLSRPSLSLTSLTAPQQQSSSSQQQQQPQQPQQQQQQQPQSRQSAASQAAASSAASSQAREPQQHQSARRSQSAGTASSSHHHTPGAASHGHHTAASTPHQQQQQQQQQHHHPSNLHTQQTSQSINAQNNQPAIEQARKAEATAASLAASSGQNYHCPDSFGFFRHHKSCDKYWACENNTATLKLCGNGLMFDDSDPKRENCAYPFSVDCGADRTDLEPPISTPHCPRLYGLFADNANCRVFYSCWNGESSKYECPPGLAYDNEQRVCVWADLVDRCDQSEVSDGFVCPDPTEVDQPGHYTRHAHPTDCRKFYVCIEGVARPYGCSLGTVFNVDSLQCDEPENVSGCEKYYGDMDPKLAKKLAREGTQGSGSGSSSQGNGNTGTSSSSSGRSSSNASH